jgi:OmpA-OmpF porin, OOP family
LLDNPDYNVLISGHTDNAGNKARNEKLSKARAESVKAYLVSKRVSGDRLSTEGFGDAKPIAPNDTAEGRTQNRRIEFTVTKK